MHVRSLTHPMEKTAGKQVENLTLTHPMAKFAGKSVRLLEGRETVTYATHLIR